MADKLDRSQIDAALAGLPGGTYDGEALVREADVPASDQDAVEAAVGRVADEIDHHPVTSRSGDSLTFRVWTHSAGGVTTKDVDLATRIDQVLTTG